MTNRTSTKPELAARIAFLEAEIRKNTRLSTSREAILREQIQVAEAMRAAAQRGLVPYVRGLETFDHWLKEHPDLREQLRPVLQELGLWEIKLGYDPGKDISLSVVSAARMASR